MDIDGVISLFGFAAHAPPAGQFQLVDGIGHLLSATAGGHLRELTTDFEIVWCSGWEEKANDYLPHALGLDAPLPFLSFDRAESAARNPQERHWKLEAIDAYAGSGRPLAWVDDAHDVACHRWAAARPGPTRLIATQPAVGLTDADVSELLGWARGLLECPVPPGAAAEAL
jgi:hypothetical protein